MAWDFGHYDNNGPDGVPNSGDDDGIVDGGVVILNSDRNTTCDTARRATAVLNHGNRDRRGEPSGADSNTAELNLLTEL
jgi:hypothetical protein